MDLTIQPASPMMSGEEPLDAMQTFMVLRNGPYAAFRPTVGRRRYDELIAAGVPPERLNLADETVVRVSWARQKL